MAFGQAIASITERTVKHHTKEWNACLTSREWLKSQHCPLAPAGTANQCHISGTELRGLRDGLGSARPYFDVLPSTPLQCSVR
jgi:hypothetical protein